MSGYMEHLTSLIAESITSSDSLHTGTNVAAVAGGVIGGIILLVIFIMVVIVKHVSR